jgi:hypothetical protein
MWWRVSQFGPQNRHLRFGVSGLKITDGLLVLLGLSPLSVAYVLEVLLHTLIMNMLSSCYMHFMIMYRA